MANSDTIYAFLKGKGLNDVQVAGVLGNLQVESGFSPTAYNANEGAIGIAQWELGRRTALDNYARSTGGSETSLNTQLGYLWTELTGSHAGALQSLRGATSVQQAADIWDVQFEGSAGTTRGARESDAAAIYRAITGHAPIGGPTNPGTTTTQPYAPPSSAGGQSTFRLFGDVPLTANQVPASATTVHTMLVAVLIMFALGMVLVELAGISPRSGNAVIVLLGIMLVVQGINHINPVAQFLVNHPLTPSKAAAHA